MISKTYVIGRAGEAPVLKTGKSGASYCKFGVAHNKPITVGDKVEFRATWYNCVAFGKTAEISCQKIKKGDIVYVEGEMETNTTDKGTFWNLSTHKVKLMPTGNTGSQEAKPKPEPASNSFDDDLPF